LIKDDLDIIPLIQRFSQALLINLLRSLPDKPQLSVTSDIAFHAELQASLNANARDT